MALDDIRDSGRFDRAIAAQRAGIREAMAVPVTGGDGVVAVLELFVTHERAGEPGRLQRFAAVTNAAVDAIVSADSSGRVLTWNRGAERLFGWTAEEMVGRPLTVIIPERFRALHVLLVEDDADHVFLVRRALAELPVVVLTSSERQEDREEALRAGATWFVCKPIDGRRFRAEVQQLADRWAVPA